MSDYVEDLVDQLSITLGVAYVLSVDAFGTSEDKSPENMDGLLLSLTDGSELALCKAPEPDFDHLVVIPWPDLRGVSETEALVLVVSNALAMLSVEDEA
jgi:hypothetical protein